MDNNVIFIGGSGRSGTNILRKLLSNHSQVASLPFEYRFIIDPDGIVDFYNSFTSNWSPYYSDVKIKRLNIFLINLAEKNNTKSNYIDWELSKYFPHYIENVQKLISNLKSFEYDGLWPGSNKNNKEYKIWFSDYKDIGFLIVDEVHVMATKIMVEAFQYLTPRYCLALVEVMYRCCLE